MQHGIKALQLKCVSAHSHRIFEADVVQVHITSFHTVGTKASASSYVVYSIEVRTQEVIRFLNLSAEARLKTMDYQGTLIKALKRYSAFVSLRRSLTREYPSMKGTSLIPPLPPKNSLGQFAVQVRSFIESLNVAWSDSKVSPIFPRASAQDFGILASVCLTAVRSPSILS